MKSRFIPWMLLLLWLPAAAAQYKTALPGYHYEFPRDHFNHPDFRTEWWYYTGNVTASDGHRFGFELAFFRQAVQRQPEQNSTWDVRDIYLAHLALSDLDGGEFFHAERMNRAGPGIAGIELSQQRIWNGNWQVLWNGSDQQLHAAEDRFSLSLSLHPEKPPVIHGEHGLSQKADGPGHASHYISFTRLRTMGTIRLKGKAYQVSGNAWMDHEFFTQQLSAGQAGWDWLSIQLNDRTELMLFRLRRKDDSIDPYSAGTYVDARGKSFFLRAGDFSLTPPGTTWTSSATSATYPVQWKILIPKLAISLEVSMPLKSQELSGQTEFVPNYWEGSISLSGHKGPAELHGLGYLEMTGYDRPVNLAW